MAEQAAPSTDQSSILVGAIETGQEIISSYGWLIVFSLVAAYVAIQKLDPLWRTWSIKRRVSRETDDTLYSDPEEIIRRQESMEVARRRLQEKYAAAAALHAEKLKQKEEEKRQEKIREWEKLQQGKGFHSKYHAAEDESASCSRTESSVTPRPPKSKDRSLRPEYNPLMGSGGGTCYRAPRRGLSRGG